jgi:hypothetical protein
LVVDHLPETSSVSEYRHAPSPNLGDFLNSS